MAKYHVLTVLEKQKLLLTKADDAETLTGWGDYYRDEGRVYDALDFYEAAQAKDRLQELRKKAVQTGHQFLFKRTMQLLKEEPREGELEELAGRCEVTGQIAYARQARGEDPYPEAKPEEESPDTPGES